MTTADDIARAYSEFVQATWVRWHAADYAESVTGEYESIVAKAALTRARARENEAFDKWRSLTAAGGSMRARTSHRAG